MSTAAPAPNKAPPPARPAEPYTKAFARFEQEESGAQPAWLWPVRQAGLSRFAQLGFPTLRQEDWRFTNVSAIAKLPFHPATRRPPEAASAAAATARLSAGRLEQFPLTRLPGPRLVFVDGRFHPALSRLPAQPDGIEIGPLTAALAGNNPALEAHLRKAASSEDNAFAALNSAFFHDGGFIHVPAGRTVEGIVQLIFVSTTTEPGHTTHPRNLIQVDRQARLTVLESYFATVSAPTVTNAVTEFVLGDQAVVEHCKFQDESPEAYHLATLPSHLGNGVNFSSHSIVTGARLSRNNIRTLLDGEGIECILNGVYLTDRDQVADHHMIVDHAKPHCASHEYFNGILAGRSKGVFHGRILVRPGAQKTDAKQTNKNLLLSDDATADAKPQLEIYADDVKCTHGATIGQLNPESIYYLRSRGIGLETARRMLIHSFAGEIIDRVKQDALREELDRLLWDRLEQLAGIAAGTPAIP